MTHVKDGTLRAYLDGELEQDEMARVAEELRTSEQAQQRLSEVQALGHEVDGILEGRRRR